RTTDRSIKSTIFGTVGQSCVLGAFIASVSCQQLAEASARLQFCAQLLCHLRKRHAPLLGGVAVANGDGIVLQGLAVDGDAKRSAGLVLATIAAADGAFVVVKDVELFFEIAIERLILFRHAVFLDQRKNRGFDWGQPW